MNPRRISIAAASVAGAGVVAALAVGSGSLAFAESPSPTPSASSTASSPTASASPTTSPNTSRAPRSGTDKTGGASADTPVTGDEAAKVIAAVKAKDSAATITTVRKDPDGSYDALGTKAGAQVRYDVSADLATITQGAGRGGGHGGASADTPVTGDEAAKVIAAVKAKDSAATITTVRKDPDGSYDALGTKAGAQVMYDVSADLATITQDTHAKR